MTFEKFKMIAAQKSQEEYGCVYFIREYFIDNFSELFIRGVTKCSQPNMGFARNLKEAKRMICKFFEHPFAHVVKLKPYQSYITIEACKPGVLGNLEYDRLNKVVLQSWSANYQAQIIEHYVTNAHFYGKLKRNNYFKKGSWVGVLYSKDLIVKLGVITQTPPSIKDVWEFRERVRLHYKDIGLKFTETEWRCDDDFPLDRYNVMIDDKEISVPASLLIPLPDYENL